MGQHMAVHLTIIHRKKGIECVCTCTCLPRCHTATTAPVGRQARSLLQSCRPGSCPPTPQACHPAAAACSGPSSTKQRHH
eukprot:992950-Pelagomonas_calceolata.AAC.2